MNEAEKWSYVIMYYKDGNDSGKMKDVIDLAIEPDGKGGSNELFIHPGKAQSEKIKDTLPNYKEYKIMDFGANPDTVGKGISISAIQPKILKNPGKLKDKFFKKVWSDIEDVMY